MPANFSLPEPWQASQGQTRQHPPSLNRACTRPQTKRARARVAYTTCRKRRVRCDVAHFGPPCWNCREDGHPCDVVKRKRQKPRCDKQTKVPSDEDGSPPPIGSGQEPSLRSSESVPSLLPANIASVDYDLLKQKRVLDIPSEPFRNVWIASFERSAYWQVPVVASCCLQQTASRACSLR